MKQLLVIIFSFLLVKTVVCQKILPGAYQMNEYLPPLAKKTVAIFANNTSRINQIHLVDTLLKKGVDVKLIFAPEHGFRGTADAGEHVENGKDAKTGLPIISLYGAHNKPTSNDLKGIDIMVFDIQDVGVRFYTYISSLQLYMEAAIENNIPLIVLDRPNPNGHYVDGPVLDTSFKSFVGMQPIPVVYGMTIGEYAQMLLAEKMLSKNANEAYEVSKKDKHIEGARYFYLHIVKCKNYTHKSMYQLPEKPSPNLPNMQSIYLYPSLCFFEGTEISVGRGTSFPFQVYGHPEFSKMLYSFTPKSVAGAKDPLYKDITCYGALLTKEKIGSGIQLKFLIDAYKKTKSKAAFFIMSKNSAGLPKDYFFNKLAGNAILMQQIKNNSSAATIKASWKSNIQRFKNLRKKYLLYKDFE